MSQKLANITIKAFVAACHWSWIIEHRTWIKYGGLLYYYAYFYISWKVLILVNLKVQLKRIKKKMLNYFSRLLGPSAIWSQPNLQQWSPPCSLWSRAIKPLQVSRTHPGISILVWPLSGLPLPRNKFTTSFPPLLTWPRYNDTSTWKISLLAL